MKDNLGQTDQKNFQPHEGKNQRPVNKDKLDHREGEEKDTKGDDRTHNKKENKSEKPFQHKEK